MGNCVSKVPESRCTIEDRAIEQYMLREKAGRVPRRRNIINSLINGKDYEIITPVADRFPNQTCNLDLRYNDVYNGYEGRLSKRSYQICV